MTRAQDPCDGTAELLKMKLRHSRHGELLLHTSQFTHSHTLITLSIRYVAMSLSPHTCPGTFMRVVPPLPSPLSAVSGVLPRPRDRTPHRQCLLYHWHAARPVVRAMQPCASAHTPSTPRSSRCPLRSRPSITRPPHLPRRARRGRMPHARPHAPHPSRLAPRASRLTPRPSRLAPRTSRLAPHAETSPAASAGCAALAAAGAPCSWPGRSSTRPCLQPGCRLRSASTAPPQ